MIELSQHHPVDRRVQDLSEPRHLADFSSDVTVEEVRRSGDSE
jgi:hypothetical protein